LSFAAFAKATTPTTNAATAATIMTTHHQAAYTEMPAAVAIFATTGIKVPIILIPPPRKVTALPRVAKPSLQPSRPS
jgi:hypothetical protein